MRIVISGSSLLKLPSVLSSARRSPLFISFSSNVPYTYISIHTYTYTYTHVYTRLARFFRSKKEKNFESVTVHVSLSFQRERCSLLEGGGGGEGKEEREDEFAPRITFSKSAPSQLPLRPIGGELKLGCRKGWRLKLKLS